MCDSTYTAPNGLTYTAPPARWMLGDAGESCRTVCGHYPSTGGGAGTAHHGGAGSCSSGYWPAAYAGWQPGLPPSALVGATMNDNTTVASNICTAYGTRAWDSPIVWDGVTPAIDETGKCWIGTDGNSDCDATIAWSSQLAPGGATWYADTLNYRRLCRCCNVDSDAVATVTPAQVTCASMSDADCGTGYINDSTSDTAVCAGAT